MGFVEHLNGLPDARSVAQQYFEAAARALFRHTLLLWEDSHIDTLSRLDQAVNGGTKEAIPQALLGVPFHEDLGDAMGSRESNDAVNVIFGVEHLDSCPCVMCMSEILTEYCLLNGREVRLANVHDEELALEAIGIPPSAGDDGGCV
jgi:hypothetical protein